MSTAKPTTVLALLVSLTAFIAIFFNLQSYNSFKVARVALDRDQVARDLAVQKAEVEVKARIAEAATETAIVKSSDPIASACAVLIVRNDPKAADCKKFMLDQAKAADLD